MSIAPSPIALRACYALSGTDRGSTATHLLRGVRYRAGVWCSATCGTDLAYHATRALRDVRGRADDPRMWTTCVQTPPPFTPAALQCTGTVLRAPYAMSGTDLGYCAVCRTVLGGTELGYRASSVRNWRRLWETVRGTINACNLTVCALRACYAMAGTDLAYRATRCPVLTWRIEFGAMSGTGSVSAYALATRRVVLTERISLPFDMQ
eukprot:285825-Rhodomonas_salina.3